MATPSSRNKRHHPPKGATASRKAFWIRPANPELDRSGGWLLQNLSIIRAAAKSRF